MNKLQTNRVLLLFLVVMSLSISVQAQQDAQYTQFMYNKLPQNAAYTGSREVWSGNKNGGIAGAPKTTSFSIHSPLKNEHFALGFWFVNDRLGIEHKNQFNATYSYRLNLGKKVKLSIGINAGLLWYKMNASQAITVDPDDPAFSQNVSRVLPDVGAGLYIYHPNFYVGASVPNFIKGDLTAKNQSGSTAKRTHGPHRPDPRCLGSGKHGLDELDQNPVKAHPRKRAAACARHDQA